MTNIDMLINGSSVQFVIHGHAGYADAGNDIVCAAVSALSTALMNLVRRYAEDDFVKDWMIQEKDDFIHIYLNTLGNPLIETTIDVFYVSFKQLQEQYPEHVSINLLP